MNRAIGALAAAIATALLAFGALPARGEDLSKPMLLVASPSLQGPYTHTALLVVPMGNKHVGFILNRSTETRMSSAFPEHAPSGKVRDPVYLGGPFMSQTVFAALRTAPKDADAANLVELMPGLVLAMDAKVIDRIIETTPNDARYFAGLIVWQPGELDAEVAAGAWAVSPADAGTVFSVHPELLWPTLSRGGARLEARSQPQRVRI